jgi:hypothetical protein
MSIEIINNLHIENTPNNKNEYGKKICPITMQVLTCNNSIKIDGILYSMNGIKMWFKTQVKKQLSEIQCKCCKKYITYVSGHYSKYDVENISIEDFVTIFEIKSPYTNLPYSNEIKRKLFEIYIENYRHLNHYKRGDLLYLINN